MTTAHKFRWVSATLLAIGIGILAFAYRNRPSPQRVEVVAGEARQGGWESVIPSGTNFILDVTGAAPQLDELREDERGEQIADWTAYGTLLHAGLPAEEVRAAMYDKVPFRHPALEETANFDYGPGRRVILRDGLVWLFYSDFDAERRRAVLGRLADQVRMELGMRPTRICVFRYRSDLMRGVVQVHREADVLVEAMFSDQFGYVEKDIKSRADFEAWLAAVDDLVHVEVLPVEGVRLGGRRFPEARTQNVTLEDVAALYQAHRQIAEQMEAADKLLADAIKPLQDAYKALVEEYNSHVSSPSALSLSDTASLDAKVRMVESLLLGRDSSATSEGAAGTSAFEKLLGRQVSHADIDAILKGNRLSPPSSRDLLNRTLGGSLSYYSATIDRLKSQVRTRLEALQEETYRTLYREGRIPPSAPGFSLDPQWDAKGLVADLELLIRDPMSLLKKAQQIIDAAESEEYDEKAYPVKVAGAQVLADAVEREKGRLMHRQVDATRLQKIVDAVRGKRGKELEDGAILPFLLLKEELSKSKDKEDAVLRTALEFLDSQHRAQCARYDGPLSGTRVGMVLFYTDLLAKLWASVDYYGEAPTEAVLGFLSAPRVKPKLEPEYWEESWRLPSTRLWVTVHSLEAQRPEKIN